MEIDIRTADARLGRFLLADDEVVERRVEVHLHPRGGLLERVRVREGEGHVLVDGGRGRGFVRRGDVLDVVGADDEALRRDDGRGERQPCALVVVFAVGRHGGYISSVLEVGFGKRERWAALQK